MAWHWKPAIKTNVIYQQRTKVKTLIFNHDRFQDVVINKNYSCRPVNLQRIPFSLYHAKAGTSRTPFSGQRFSRQNMWSLIDLGGCVGCIKSRASSTLRINFFRHMAKKRSRSVQEKNRNTSSAPNGRQKSKSIQGRRQNSRLSPQSQTTTRSTHSVKRDLKSTRVPSKGSTGNNHDGVKESTKRKHF